MTDLTQSPKDQSTEMEEAVVIEETDSQPKEASNLKNKNKLLWLFTVINLFIVLILCSGAYWYYNQINKDESNTQSELIELRQGLREQDTNIQNTITKLEQTAQSLQRNITNAQQRSDQDITNVKNGLTQVHGQAKILTQTTDALNQRFSEMSGRRPSDWLLAEANYLVTMAGRKVYLEKDIRTAMTLLAEADARLNDLNDPSLFPVRALIAGDIQALKQVNPVSTDSIALTISGMLPKVSALPLDKLQLPQSNNSDDLTLSEDVRDWRTNLKKTWQSTVGDLFTIDYVDQPLEPYLAERQQWLIEQQLKHTLSQALTAALNEQTELYRASTQQAIALLLEHYQMDDLQVSQFLITIQELQNIDLSRVYPVTLESQASLKAIIESRIQSLFNNSSTPISNDDNLDTSL